MEAVQAKLRFSRKMQNMDKYYVLPGHSWVAHRGLEDGNGAGAEAGAMEQGPRSCWQVATWAPEFSEQLSILGLIT